MPRETENPQLPREASWAKQGKAENRKKGPGVGTAHAGTRDSRQSRSPTPGTPTFQQRHRSPPSQGMPVDTAGKGHTPEESQGPPARHLRASRSQSAGSGAGKKCFLKNHSLPERLQDDANPMSLSLSLSLSLSVTPVRNVLLRMTASDL